MAEETCPPPNTTDVASEHDAFLTALLRPPSSQAISRVRLYRALLKETGLQRRQCWRIVAAFCERRAIFPRPPAPVLWFSVIIALMILALPVAFVFLIYQSLRINASFPEGAGDAAGAVRAVTVFIIATLTAALLLGAVSLSRRSREAEDAKRKAATWQ